MAPGIVQNSNPIVNDQLDVVESGRDIIKVKTCPIDHFDELNSVKEKKKCIKIRPKVLKNHGTKDYLYDRLYNHPCPRVVSRELLITYRFLINRHHENKVLKTKGNRRI